MCIIPTEVWLWCISLNENWARYIFIFVFVYLLLLFLKETKLILCFCQWSCSFFFPSFLPLTIFPPVKLFNADRSSLWNVIGGQLFPAAVFYSTYQKVTLKLMNMNTKQQDPKHCWQQLLVFFPNHVGKTLILSDTIWYIDLQCEQVASMFLQSRAVNFEWNHVDYIQGRITVNFYSFFVMSTRKTEELSSIVNTGFR